MGASAPFTMINETLTARDIYLTALALTFTNEANAQDFRTFFLSFLNLCCQEALDTENSIRHAYNDTNPATPMPILTAAPVYSDFDAVVGYHDVIVRAALPYGVASYYFQDDMDDWRYAEHRGRFVSALKEASKARFSTVEVIYG